MAASMFNVTSSRFWLNISCTCRFLPKIFRNQRNIRPYSSANDNDLYLEDSNEDDNVTDQLRNFSNLSPTLYRRYHGHVPKQEYLERKTFSSYRQRKDYLKKLYARYGSESGIDPGMCWPSKEELEMLKEDERDWEPTFQQMVANMKEEKEKEAQFRKQMQEKVEKNMAKMESLIKEHENKKYKEQIKEQEAEEKRKILLDEAEEYYGYPVNVSSEDFKEFAKNKREKERKAMKELKKKRKQGLLSAKLQDV